MDVASFEENEGEQQSRVGQTPGPSKDTKVPSLQGSPDMQSCQQFDFNLGRAYQTTDLEN